MMSQFETLRAQDGGMVADKDEIMQRQTDGTTILSLKYKGAILLGANSRSANVRHFKLSSNLWEIT